MSLSVRDYVEFMCDDQRLSAFDVVHLTKSEENAIHMTMNKPIHTVHGGIAHFEIVYCQCVREGNVDSTITCVWIQPLGFP